MEEFVGIIFTFGYPYVQRKERKSKSLMQGIPLTLIQMG